MRYQISTTFNHHVFRNVCGKMKIIQYMNTTLKEADWRVITLLASNKPL